jgi:hypothetical protein
MKTVLGMSLLVVSATLFYSAFLYKEESSIASKIRLQSEPTFAVSKVVDGNWDSVCLLVELMKPDAVAKNVLGSEGRFLGLGNGNRPILLDGESGLLLAKKNTNEYSIFLAFDHDQITFEPSETVRGADKCFGYSSATLTFLNIGTRKDWKYLELKGE